MIAKPLATATALILATGASATGADTIYVGGDILTMRQSTPEYAEALAVKNGKISYVGSRSGAMKLKSGHTRIVDLKGRTMLPGFIDAHGHIVYFGKNLIDASLVGVSSIGELLQRMRKHAATVKPGEWIVGFGFRVPSLAENRYPTVEELDGISADVPVLVVDQSGHLGSANSAAFKAARIGPSTPDPQGGVIARKADGKTPAGPIEETALNVVRAARPAFTGQLADNVATKGAELWASYGQTTAQDCGVGLGNDDIDIVRNAIDKRLYPLDVYICAKDSMIDATLAAAQQVSRDYADTPTFMATQAAVAAAGAGTGAGGGGAQRLLAERPDLDKRYVNRVRLGGIKLWLDGSIPTAYFTKPYATNPPGKTGAYRGFPQIKQEDLDSSFDRFWTSNVQINMHMNGDAAADQALDAIGKAVAKYGMRDHRPVFIHATWLRPDQIAKMREYGAIPTYTTGSLPLGGMVAASLWGEERANGSLPMATLERIGVRFTLNHDAPILPTPDVMFLVDAAVNRVSGGKVMGPEERISPYVALRAVTAYAAWQIKEEKTKGTLEVGKLADLVVLEKNPLKVPPATLKDVKVLETIKEGRTIFTRSDATASVPQLVQPLEHSHAHHSEQHQAPTPATRETLAILAAAAGSGR